MMRNMLTSLLLYERIRTTKKRAQVLKPMVDKAINLGRGPRKDLAIRRINEVVSDENACRKILEVFIHRYDDRTSGYTRIKAVGSRQGDGAELVDVMLVEGKDVAPVAAAPAAKKTPKAKAATTKASPDTSATSK